MARSVGLTFTEWCGLGSGDVARPDAVTLDVVFAVFRSDVACEHLESALGSRIGRDGFASQFAHHGADVDDFSVSLADHAGDDCLGDDERGVQVDVDHLAEFCGRHFAHGDAFDDSGVVHQNVDGSHFLFHAGDESLHRFLVGHVAHVSVGLDSFFAVGS